MKLFANCSAVALILAACSLPLLGCAAEVDAIEGIENSETTADELGTAEDVMESSQEILACSQCDNCVLYARCRQPSLPFGLTSYADKVAIINTQTAAAGEVAIIKTSSSYGHVAYVTSVSGSTIHIAEGNWPNGSCGTRSGTKAGLNITGFFKP